MLSEFFYFLLVGFLVSNNSIRARVKGQNPFVWIIITLAAFCLGGFIGIIVTMLLFYKGPADPNAMGVFFAQDPIHSLFALFCGVGGYLAIRYILDRMPDSKMEK